MSVNCLPAAQFELFDDVADLFESVVIPVLLSSGVRNYQEGGSFKENNFVSFTNFTKLFQMCFQCFDIGDHRVNNRRPRLKSQNLTGTRKLTL